MVSSQRRRTRRFDLGRKKVAPAARRLLVGQSILDCFARHENGDFGDIGNDDFDANLDGIADSGRIVSMYHCDTNAGQRATVYVITHPKCGETRLGLAEEFCS